MTNKTKQIHECNNCGVRFTDDEIVPLVEVQGLNERVDVGSVVPSGECPDCKALVYLLPAIPKGVTRAKITLTVDYKDVEDFGDLEFPLEKDVMRCIGDGMLNAAGLGLVETYDLDIEVESGR